ncbi:MAG TPA: phosphopantetheine-binding protein [Frankiaceae bacterium]|nr:phosphopantetheine-binding protein [Frankiaceae bacterium]
MTETDRTPPPSPLATVVASVVGGVLGVDPPPPDAHFFALGGDSLAALEVTALLQEDLGVEVPLELIFDFPVLADLAGELASLTGGTVS